MKFERGPKGPEQERLTMDRVESGDLTEHERAGTDALVKEAERYGIILDFWNYDRESGKAASVLENIFRMQGEADEYVRELQNIANEEAFKRLSSEEKERYMREEKPGNILKAPDVKTLPQKEIDRLSKKRNLKEAAGLIYGDKASFNPWTSEELPPLEDKEARALAVIEIANFLDRKQKALREAARLQRESGKIIVNKEGFTGAEEYLRSVKERLGK